MREKAACHRQLVHLVEHPLRCQPDQEVQHGSPEQRPTGGKPRHVAVTEEEEDVGGTAFRERFRHVRGNTISHFRLQYSLGADIFQKLLWCVSKLFTLEKAHAKYYSGILLK